MSDEQAGDLAFITRSLLDDWVWVVHIPNTDIATSENHAGALWRAKQYVEWWYRHRGCEGAWEREGKDTWAYREPPT